MKTYLQEKKEYIDAYLGGVLQAPNAEYARLYEAMRYSLLLGGKRIRPILTMLVMESLQGSVEAHMPSICAIELIHSYSLVHDDLPAMDNDDYRRGKPTNHKVYGDGLAILAGDGLLTYAFTMIGQDACATAEQKVALMNVLSYGAGPEGMVGGQAFDLESEGKILPLEEMEVLHQGKTGALFLAAIQVALILCNADEATRRAYEVYGRELGLLFQITDDILDVTGTLEDLGKAPGSDIAQDKATYVSIFGLEGAKERAEASCTRAIEALASLPGDHSRAMALAEYILHRSH